MRGPRGFRGTWNSHSSRWARDSRLETNPMNTSLSKKTLNYILSSKIKSLREDSCSKRRLRLISLNLVSKSSLANSVLLSLRMDNKLELW